MCWLSNRLPTLGCGLVSNYVLACRDLAVAWLKRGASARRFWNQACPLRVITGTGRRSRSWHE